MRKFLVLTCAAAFFAVGGAGVAVAAPGDHGNACPPASKNPGGDPSCGKQKPPPEPPEPGCVEEGPISSIVDQVEQGFRDNGGEAVADVLHTVNCEIIVPLEDALGIGPAQMGV